MPIGILCATERELAPVLELMTNNHAERAALLTFHRGNIEGKPVVAAFSGVCKTNAALAAQLMIDRYACEALLVCGTAGGMDARLTLLEIAVSTEVLHWDVDPGILADYHPYIKNAIFPADAALLQKARSVAPDHPCIHFGRMVTGECFIDQDHRAEINAQHAPLCVDMETASFAQVAHANAVPWLAIRAITDTAAQSGSTMFEQTVERASAGAAFFLRDLIRRL